MDYVVLPGGQEVAEQLMYFLATLLGPIGGRGKTQGVCSPARRWSRCRCRSLEGGKAAVDSGSSYHSGHAGESKAQRLSVPTCKTPFGLLVLLAAQPPDAGLPTLRCTATRSSLQHLLFF